MALHPPSDSDDLPHKPKLGRPKKEIKATEHVNVRMTEAEKAELQKRTQSFYTSDSHLVKAAAIHSNRHTLKRLISSEEAMPDELSLRLVVMNAPGKPYHRKVVMYHYPKFKSLISRFEFYLIDQRLQIIFARNQIYEFVDDIEEDITIALMQCTKILVILEDEHMMDEQGEWYFAPLVLYKTPSLLYAVPDYMQEHASEHWEKF